MRKILNLTAFISIGGIQLAYGALAARENVVAMPGQIAKFNDMSKSEGEPDPNLQNVATLPARSDHWLEQSESEKAMKALNAVRTLLRNTPEMYGAIGSAALTAGQMLASLIPPTPPQKNSWKGSAPPAQLLSIAFSLQNGPTYLNEIVRVATDVPQTSEPVRCGKTGASNRSCTANR